MTVRRLGVDDLLAARASAAPPVLIDVRDRGEAERIRIPGAANVPRHHVEERIGALVRDRATPLVVVDGGVDDARGRPDDRADLTAATLRRLDYADVACLEGGVSAWRRAGLPLVCGVSMSGKAFRERLKCAGEMQCVDVATLQAWRREGTRVALVDVRTAAEHLRECIPGAVSIEGFDIALHGVDLAAESDVIAVYSNGCTRSIVSARTLGLLGIGDVVALEGGLLSWRLAGLEVERGSRLTRFAASVGSRQFGELGVARLAKMRGVRSLDGEALAALLAAPARNVHAFDLRDRAAFEAGHIPGTVALRVDDALARSDDFIALRAAPVVFIAGDEFSARLSAVWQMRLGSTDVAVLAGGVDHWIAEGRPVAVGPEPPLGWHEARGHSEAVPAGAAADWLAARPRARVLHVDASASFRRGHLPGAAWTPRGRLESRIADVVPEVDAPLLLTCVSGLQAAFAAATLRELGRREVAWLEGGTTAWAANGGALASADLPPQDDELLSPVERDDRAMREYLDWAASPPGAGG